MSLRSRNVAAEAQARASTRDANVDDVLRVGLSKLSLSLCVPSPDVDHVVGVCAVGMPPAKRPLPGSSIPDGSWISASYKYDVVLKEDDFEDYIKCKVLAGKATEEKKAEEETTELYASMGVEPDEDEFDDGFDLQGVLFSYTKMSKDCKDKLQQMADREVRRLVKYVPKAPKPVGVFVYSLHADKNKVLKAYVDSKVPLLMEKMPSGESRRMADFEKAWSEAYPPFHKEYKEFKVFR